MWQFQVGVFVPISTIPAKIQRKCTLAGLAPAKLKLFAAGRGEPNAAQPAAQGGSRCSAGRVRQGELLD